MSSHFLMALSREEQLTLSEMTFNEG